MFERLYGSAIDRQAHVVRTGAWLLRDAPAVQDAVSPQTLSFGEQTYATGIEYLDADFYPSMWLHLHHRRLWEIALPHFPLLRLVGEDNLTSFVLAFFAGTVVSLSSLGYFYIERGNSLSGDLSFGSVVRHIEDRATIVKLLHDFVNTCGGKAGGCLNTLTSNNRGLLFSYIDSLRSPEERLEAVSCFERVWGESAPVDRKAAWGAAV
jgi:hypothetical protein